MTNQTVSQTDLRAARAAQQFTSYRFSIVRLHLTDKATGQVSHRTLVKVVSPAGKTYWVQPGGQCSCPDHQNRNSVCKHAIMTKAFLASDDAAARVAAIRATERGRAV